MKDINRKIFDRYLKKAKEVGRITITSDDPEEVLNTIDLAEGDTLLNAGAALFVDSNMNELQMAKFASDERLMFLDINRQTGCILALADSAVQYITEAMDWRVEFDGSLERKEIPEVPVAAIREAVVNAFAHRLIESRQSVEVAIYKSYIDIYSPGTFPKSVEPEMFIQKQMKPIRRNPLITTTLYYSKDMESFATGLKRINEECQKAGVKFEFNREPYGFTVRFHRHCGEAWDLTDQHRDYHPGGDKGGETGGDQGVDWIVRKEKVLAEIRKEPAISTTRMADHLHLSRRQVEKTLDQLKNEGRLYREGSARSGHWVINK